LTRNDLIAFIGSCMNGAGVSVALSRGIEYTFSSHSLGARELIIRPLRSKGRLSR
jgi:hypothetical protein